jgi:hypothetical protein
MWSAVFSPKDLLRTPGATSLPLAWHPATVALYLSNLRGVWIVKRLLRHRRSRVGAVRVGSTLASARVLGAARGTDVGVGAGVGVGSGAGAGVGASSRVDDGAEGSSVGAGVVAMSTCGAADQGSGADVSPGGAPSRPGDPWAQHLLTSSIVHKFVVSVASAWITVSVCECVCVGRGWSWLAATLLDLWTLSALCECVRARLGVKGGC